MADGVVATVLGSSVSAVLAAGMAVTYAGERRRSTRLHVWAVRNGWTCVEGGAGAGQWPRRFAHLREFHVLRYVTGQIGLDGPQPQERRAPSAQADPLARRRAGIGLDGPQPQERRAPSAQADPVTRRRAGIESVTVLVADCDHWARDSRRPVPMTVFVLRLPGPSPDIAVLPRGRGGAKVARLLGRRQDVAVGDDEFDARFRVEAFDPAHARKALTADVRSAMLTDDIPLWSVQAGELVTAAPDRLTPPAILPGCDRLRHAASVLGQVRGAIPSTASK